MTTLRQPLSNSLAVTHSQLLIKALASIANAVFITDHKGRIVWTNDAFSRLSGYSSQEALGQTPSFLKSGQQRPPFYRELWQTILSGNVWRGEVVERRKDGVLYTVDEVITPLRDDSGAITHYVAVQHDITQRKQETAREHFLAYHDPLTGLSNRALFLDMLEQSIANANRTHLPLALLYVDIDGFKRINDALGHKAGDQLLIAVANRLRAAVRKTDIVARLGGDEMAILQTDLADTHITAKLAQKLLRVISQPFVLEGHKIDAAVSIGIALYPDDAGNIEDLLNNADQAMYLAKSSGRNCHRTYKEISADKSSAKTTFKVSESRAHHFRRSVLSKVVADMARDNEALNTTAPKSKPGRT